MSPDRIPIVALTVALLAPVLHGVAGAEIVDDDHDSVDGSPEPTVEALIAADPELAALASDYGAASRAWSNDFTCSALASESLLTRIRASVSIDRSEGEPVSCPNIGKVEPGVIRHAALVDGWNDPAVVYRVHRHGCTDPEGGDDCNPERLQRRLRAIDGDNVAVYFLPLVDPGDWNTVFRNDQIPEDSGWPAGRQALMDAANANTFDLYLTAGRYDAYLEARNFATAQPAPEPPPRMLALLGEKNPFAGMPPDSGWLGSMLLGLADIEIAGLSPWQGVWTGLCARAAQLGDNEAIAACGHIADVLIDSSNVPISLNPGYAIHKVLDDPSTATVGGMTGGWDFSLRTLVYACEVSNLGGSPIPSATVPEQRLEQWERDLQNLGERDAIRQAAIRKYAVDPDAFVVDPARCRDALELDEATQRGIVQAFRPEGSTSSSLEAGLAALGEALKP